MSSSQPEPEERQEDETQEIHVVRGQERKPSQVPGPSIKKINRIINYAFWLVESLIGIRLLLKILGGNPGSSFVDFIYSITEPFVAPFRSALGYQTWSTGIGIGVFEFGTFLAIITYVFLNYAIVKLISILFSRR